MQKLLFLPFLLALACPLSAQKVKTADVPQAVRTAFAQKFPGATVEKWTKEDTAFEAEFDGANDQEMSANFAADGAWLETETEIAFAELPASVRTAVQGQKVKEAARIERAGGTTVYEVEVKGKGDLLFDAQGNPVK